MDWRHAGHGGRLRIGTLRADVAGRQRQLGQRRADLARLGHIEEGQREFRVAGIAHQHLHAHRLHLELHRARMAIRLARELASTPLPWAGTRASPAPVKPASATPARSKDAMRGIVGLSRAARPLPAA